jgi:hypothetical protein
VRFFFFIHHPSTIDGAISLPCRNENLEKNDTEILGGYCGVDFGFYAGVHGGFWFLA